MERLEDRDDGLLCSDLGAAWGVDAIDRRRHDDELEARDLDRTGLRLVGTAVLHLGDDNAAAGFDTCYELWTTRRLFGLAAIDRTLRTHSEDAAGWVAIGVVVMELCARRHTEPDGALRRRSAQVRG